LRNALNDTTSFYRGLRFCPESSGQAALNPEFAEFLVECGIDSVSVVPDSFITVKNHVAKAESRKSQMSSSGRRTTD
jgi:phosphoenolpyruvate-protein kinase (PTS system EI component)